MISRITYIAHAVMLSLYKCILFSCSAVCVSSDLGPSEEGSTGVAGGGPVVLAQLGGLEVTHAALGHHPPLALVSIKCCCVTSDTAVHISCAGLPGAWLAGCTSLGWTLINGEQGAAHLSRGRGCGGR